MFIIIQRRLPNIYISNKSSTLWYDKTKRERTGNSNGLRFHINRNFRQSESLFYEIVFSSI